MPGHGHGKGHFGRNPWTQNKTALIVAGGLACVALFFLWSWASESERRSKVEGVMQRDSQLLQGQIDEMRGTLERLSEENKDLNDQLQHLTTLRGKELHDCSERLAQAEGKAASAESRVETISQVHREEKEGDASELENLNDDLEREKQRAVEMELKAKMFAEKLEQSKRELDELQRLKEDANARYKQQASQPGGIKSADGGSHAPAQHGAAGAAGAGAGAEERLKQIEKLIETMNRDLHAKTSTIQDLMDQKKASDRAVRKLESKLLEAGVDPAEIERAISDQRTKQQERFAAEKSAVNPAMAAAIQVTSGVPHDMERRMGSTKAQILFAKVDDNGDHTIDPQEFLAHMQRSGGGGGRPRNAAGAGAAQV